MIGGKQRTIGSRAEVWHGTATKTSGGLTKSHLMQNKHGRIVSRKKHATAKKENRLVKAGFGTKKGHFGYVTADGATSKKGSRRRKHKGGMNGSRGITSNNHSVNSNSATPQKMMMAKHHINNNSQSGGRIMNNNSNDASASNAQTMVAAKHHTNNNNNSSSIRSTGLKGGRRKMKGGMHSLNPSDYKGSQGVGASSIDVQLAAGNAG